YSIEPCVPDQEIHQRPAEKRERRSCSPPITPRNVASKRVRRRTHIADVHVKILRDCWLGQVWRRREKPFGLNERHYRGWSAKALAIVSGGHTVPVEHGKNSGLISKRFLARFGRSNNKRPRRGRGPDSSLGIFGCGGSRLPSACQINSAGAKGFPKGSAKSHNGMTALRVPESDMEN